MKRLWAYIKGDEVEDKKDALRSGASLQDAKNRRMINADDKLLPIFGGKKQVSMFEMTKLVSSHLS
jgi:chromatin remodeling complex protein RSC6